MKKILKENINKIIFFIILTVVCLVLNTNFQDFNNLLKRGTTLEYSYAGALDNQAEEKIENKLSKLKIKYDLVENENIENYDYYDFENIKVQNSLIVTIPIKITEKNKAVFDEISNFVFENFKDAKLIDLRNLNTFYYQPYGSFLYIVLVLLISYIFYLPFRRFKKEEVENKKGATIKDFLIKSKEKGFKYFIKTLLFDEETAEGKKSTAWEIVSTILFVLVCVIVIRYFIGELRWIPSGSMRPTIVEKDRVFVEKLQFPQKEIKRGDILVFYPPGVVLSNSPLSILARLSGILCKDTAYIKRVIGLPGDKLEIKQDNISKEYRVFINDNPLNEPYISSKIEWSQCREDMYCGPFVIPDNNYFMMGDNRNNSQDSRFWGFLDKKRIIGRANFMFFPFGRINILTDKYFSLKKNDKEEAVYILNRY